MRHRSRRPPWLAGWGALGWSHDFIGSMSAMAAELNRLAREIERDDVVAAVAEERRARQGAPR
ncbi:MAG: hypothetical protein ABSA53_20390 [Streptosporangiaceae bacterium]